VTDPLFPGWKQPTENWSKLPHDLIDLMRHMKVSELKVTLYLLRHTWGFGNFDDFQTITLDEFQYGRKGKGGHRLDNGTGLSKPSIIAGLREAEERGTINCIADTSDKARIRKGYKLRGKESLPRSKTLTSEVKNLYLDLNKDTSKEIKDPFPSEKKQNIRQVFNSEMEKQFSMSTSIPIPRRKTVQERKSAGKLWNTPLWTIYELFRPEEERQREVKMGYDDASLKLTLSLIDDAVKKMRESNLTIATPASIVNIATSIYAEKYANQNMPEQSADFWEEYV